MGWRELLSNGHMRACHDEGVMITGIHILLSYACTNQCGHCFVFSCPGAKGTFTLGQLRGLIGQLPEIGSVSRIYFEGGEPFLFYPLLLQGIRLVREIGLEVGIVSNAYWATSEEDSQLYLEPLAELGITDLSLSDDSLHRGDDPGTARFARAAAEKLGIPASVIAIDPPTVDTTADGGSGRGEPIIGGSTMLKGRAVETFAGDLPLRVWSGFTECRPESLDSPKRVHVDAYGNVLLCQGLSIGNFWRTPLAELIASYDGAAHPICGPLLRGGPAALIAEYDVGRNDQYADACHCCYSARRLLLDRFPEYLAPRQVYGL